MTSKTTLRLKLTDFINTDVEKYVMEKVNAIHNELQIAILLYLWFDEGDFEGTELRDFLMRWEDEMSFKTIVKQGSETKSNDFVFFDIRPEGNWEGKIILDELKEPDEEIIKQLLQIRMKRKKPFFDKKNQLDLNCLWVSSLISLNSIIPNENYLKTAENFYEKIEKKFCVKSIFHSYSEDISFIEDYAYFIQCLLDLSDATLNPKYSLLAKKYCDDAINKFYDNNNKIFQKNEKSKNDIFINPIDISDNTLPNANSIMLINFSRLGYINEAKELSKSLNGYLNIYKNFMTSSLKALDFFKEINSGKNCNSDGCQI